MVFEGCFYKANSACPDLHGTTLRLHEAEMKGGIIVYVIHVEGTRMTKLGIDGLYRGDLMEGVINGKYP